MKLPLTITLFVVLQIYVTAQPNFTANDQVRPYTEPFVAGVNPGDHEPNWDDVHLADIAKGNPALSVEGIGMDAFRMVMSEVQLHAWGYEAQLPNYEHFDALGMNGHVITLEHPYITHQDTTQYCPGVQSQMFFNMYLPIWDNGENGTPINDENYAAAYVYKTAMLYGAYTDIYEIWNEPDFDYAGNAWKPRGVEGNWWENVPDPCEYKLLSPFYSYVRMLRISYEVIKTVDPEAYVAIGGIGYESFLDLTLRLTDNPDGGAVTAEYPLTGGAYFDMLSYHVYPHLSGLRYWSDAAQDFVYERHSDAAVDVLLNFKDNFEVLLRDYGYDGVTYPKKPYIITETNLASIPFGFYIGSEAAQRNYRMKAQIAAMKNDIHRIFFYDLADRTPAAEAASWVDATGMYRYLSDAQPYDGLEVKESGIAGRTMAQLLNNCYYDPELTAALQLTDAVQGGVFVNQETGAEIAVLWARTGTDQSEEASVNYGFPATLERFRQSTRLEWDYAATGASVTTLADNILLSGSPSFFVDPSMVSSAVEQSAQMTVSVFPNPVSDWITVQIDGHDLESLRLEMTDQLGRIVYIDHQPISTGTATINVSTQQFPSGIYLLRINNEKGKSVTRRVVKR